MNRLTIIVAMGLFATAALAAPGAGGMRATPTARPAAPTTTTTRPTTTAPSTKSAHMAGTTGQPNQSCEDIPNQPGNSISAPGSAFNPDGVAGGKYAGTQPQNTINSHTNSQYDVACASNHSH